MLPCLALAAFAVPAAPAVAQSPGGFEAGDPAPATAQAPVGTLLSRRGELLGEPLSFKGTVDRRFAGRPVVLQRRETDATWTEVGRGAADAEGAFRISWRTDHIGRFQLRAVPMPAEGTTAGAPPTVSRGVTVFKPARATFFGPGLYGEETACGRTLTTKLQGVAHRTLPCGTLVDVYYEGRMATVPVVDRGPFTKGYSWDLTSATARRLRFTASDTIGAVRVRDERATLVSS